MATILLLRRRESASWGRPPDGSMFCPQPPSCRVHSPPAAPTTPRHGEGQRRGARPSCPMRNFSEVHPAPYSRRMSDTSLTPYGVLVLHGLTSGMGSVQP